MNCKGCNFWKPAYRGIGECTREGRHNSTFWIEGSSSDKRLLTFADFHCKEFTPIVETDKETL